MDTNINSCTEVLEALLDKYGPLNVMTGLELVLGEKAHFVASSESVGTPSRNMETAWRAIGASVNPAVRAAARYAETLGW